MIMIGQDRRPLHIVNQTEQSSVLGSLTNRSKTKSKGLFARQTTAGTKSNSQRPSPQTASMDLAKAALQTPKIIDLSKN